MGGKRTFNGATPNTKSHFSLLITFQVFFSFFFSYFMYTDHCHGSDFRFCQRRECWVTFLRHVYSWLTPAPWGFGKGGKLIGIRRQVAAAGWWALLIPFLYTPPPQRTLIVLSPNCQWYISYNWANRSAKASPCPLSWCGRSLYWEWHQGASGWSPGLVIFQSGALWNPFDDCKSIFLTINEDLFRWLKYEG